MATRTLPGRIGLLFASVVLLAVGTAALGHFLLGAYSGFGDALWRSFTHMTDPGALGDDATPGERVTGVAQVLIGMVFLAGVFLAVLTEVVNRALRHLRQPGDPALRVAGHLLVIGINDTLGDVQTLLTAALGRDCPPIVVMLPPASARDRQDAHRALAGYPGRCHVVVADPEGDGFNRVCAGAARHIVLLSPDDTSDRADLEATFRATLLNRHLGSVGSFPPVAVEMRRGRNVDALWYDSAFPDEPPVRRFPAGFDALVNDRNIGALLGLVALNPHFSRVFLNPDDGLGSPRLIPSGEYAGATFAQARDRLEGSTLLGVLRGEGTLARAGYLPPGDRQIEPDERLIVIRDDSDRAGPDPEFDPDSVKVAPARPGPLLILGLSDRVNALLEVLARRGFDFGRVTVLSPGDRQRNGSPPSRSAMQAVEGDPADPAAIRQVIERAEPAVVFVAAGPGREAEAVVSARFASRETLAPIVLEQTTAGHGSRDLAGDRITVVSTSMLTAGTIALSLVDPALVVAREAMIADPELRLESLIYTGRSSLPLRSVSRIFGRAGYCPLAVSLAGTGGDGLEHGDCVLALSRDRTTGEGQT